MDRVEHVERMYDACQGTCFHVCQVHNRVWALWMVGSRDWPTALHMRSSIERVWSVQCIDFPFSLHHGTYALAAAIHSTDFWIAWGCSNCFQWLIHLWRTLHHCFVLQPIGSVLNFSATVKKIKLICFPVKLCFISSMKLNAFLPFFYVRANWSPNWLTNAHWTNFHDKETELRHNTM